MKQVLRVATKIAGFAVAALLSTVLYLGWIIIEVSTPSLASWRDSLPAALLLCIVGGFLAALVLMTVPWIFVILIYRKTRIPGAAYFACAGSLLMVLLGSTASSLSPKPLFIEDQTFVQGVLVAIQRQGVCFLLSGALFGLTYWFLAERSFPPKNVLRTASSTSPVSPIDDHTRSNGKGQRTSAIP